MAVAPLPGRWYALAAVPRGLAWLPALLIIYLVAASIIRRWIAWRAWVILLFWVAEADVAPVVISRLTWYPSLLALDTRYVADAVHVLAVCVGLAFIPLSGLASEGRAPAGARSQRLASAIHGDRQCRRKDRRYIRKKPSGLR